MLEDKYQIEDEQIRSTQTNVDTLRKELHIVDFDPNSFEPTATMTQEQLREYHSSMMEGETSYMRSKEQLDQLKSLDKDQLMDVLPTISKDDELNGLLSKLHDAEQNYVTLTNAYSPANPDVIRVQSLMDELNREIDARVDGVMIGMENNLNTEKTALDTLSNQVASAAQKDQEEAVRGQPYWEAKRTAGEHGGFPQIASPQGLNRKKLIWPFPKLPKVESPPSPSRA